MSDYNVFLEHIKLVASRDDWSAVEFDKIAKAEVSSESASGYINYLVETLNRRIENAKKEKKEAIESDEELLGAIATFQKEHYPNMEERHVGILQDHRNPFPDYHDYKIISLQDAEDILHRLAYLTKLEDGFATKVARQLKAHTDMQNLIVTPAAEALGRNNPNKTLVANQKTG